MADIKKSPFKDLKNRPSSSNILITRDSSIPRITLNAFLTGSALNLVIGAGFMGCAYATTNNASKLLWVSRYSAGATIIGISYFSNKIN